MSLPETPAPSGLPRHRHLPGLLVVVILVATVIRIAFFAELMHRFPFYGSTCEGYDQHLYDTWAMAIVGGDWLSRSQGPFYGSPLYAYVLAANYAITGPGNVAAGIAMNGLFGVCAAALAAVLGARFFGLIGGLTAGLLMALNGAQLSTEAMLLSDSLVPAFCLAALWLIARQQSHERASKEVRPWPWVLPGLLLGAAVLAKGFVVLGAAGLCATVAAPALRRQWKCLAAGAAMAAGICIVQAAPILRNGLMYGQWTVALNGPVTLYVGNAPGSTGIFLKPAGFSEKAGRLDASGQPASAWLRELGREVRAHPGAVGLVLLRKAALFFNSWDAPDNGNYYFVRRYAFTLKALTFGPLPLYVVGFLGLVLTVRRWRILVPFYVFAALFALGVILTVVNGRYKLPFLAWLTVLGGGAAATLTQHLRAHRYWVGAVTGLGAVVLASAFWPRGPIGLQARWSPLRPLEFINNAAVLSSQGRGEEAMVLLEDGADLFPWDPRFAERLAYLYLAAGRPQDAAVVTERALARNVVTQRILERRVLAYRALSLSEEARQAALDLAQRYPDSKLAGETIPDGSVPSVVPPG